MAGEEKAIPPSLMTSSIPSSSPSSSYSSSLPTACAEDEGAVPTTSSGYTDRHDATHTTSGASSTEATRLGDDPSLAAAVAAAAAVGGVADAGRSSAYATAAAAVDVRNCSPMPLRRANSTSSLSHSSSPVNPKAVTTTTDTVTMATPSASLAHRRARSDPVSEADLVLALSESTTDGSLAVSLETSAGDDEGLSPGEEDELVQIGDGAFVSRRVYELMRSSSSSSSASALAADLSGIVAVGGKGVSKLLGLAGRLPTMLLRDSSGGLRRLNFKPLSARATASAATAAASDDGAASTVHVGGACGGVSAGYSSSGEVVCGSGEVCDAAGTAPLSPTSATAAAMSNRRLFKFLGRQATVPAIDVNSAAPPSTAVPGLSPADMLKSNCEPLQQQQQQQRQQATSHLDADSTDCQKSFGGSLPAKLCADHRTQGLTSACGSQATCLATPVTMETRAVTGKPLLLQHSVSWPTPVSRHVAGTGPPLSQDLSNRQDHVQVQPPVACQFTSAGDAPPKEVPLVSGGEAACCRSNLDMATDGAVDANGVRGAGVDGVDFEPSVRPSAVLCSKSDSSIKATVCDKPELSRRRSLDSLSSACYTDGGAGISAFDSAVTLASVPICVGMATASPATPHRSAAERVAYTATQPIRRVFKTIMRRAGTADTSGGEGVVADDDDVVPLDEDGLAVSALVMSADGSVATFPPSPLLHSQARDRLGVPSDGVAAPTVKSPKRSAAATRSASQRPVNSMVVHSRSLSFSGRLPFLLERKAANAEVSIDDLVASGCSIQAVARSTSECSVTTDGLPVAMPIDSHGNERRRQLQDYPVGCSKAAVSPSNASDRCLGADAAATSDTITAAASAVNCPVAGRVGGTSQRQTVAFTAKMPSSGELHCHVPPPLAAAAVAAVSRSHVECEQERHHRKQQQSSLASGTYQHEVAASIVRSSSPSSGSRRSTASSHSSDSLPDRAGSSLRRHCSSGSITSTGTSPRSRLLRGGKDSLRRASTTSSNLPAVVRVATAMSWLAGLVSSLLMSVSRQTSSSRFLLILLTFVMVLVSTVINWSLFTSAPTQQPAPSLPQLYARVETVEDYRRLLLIEETQYQQRILSLEQLLRDSRSALAEVRASLKEADRLAAAAGTSPSAVPSLSCWRCADGERFLDDDGTERQCTVSGGGNGQAQRLTAPPRQDPTPEQDPTPRQDPTPEQDPKTPRQDPTISPLRSGSSTESAQNGVSPSRVGHSSLTDPSISTLPSTESRSTSSSREERLPANAMPASTLT